MAFNARRSKQFQSTKSEGRLQGPWEFGECPRQGERSDLKQIKDLIDTGNSLLTVAESHFGSFVRYSKGIREYKLMKDAVDATIRDVKVIVYYGPSGTGKSLRAFQENPGAFRLMKGNYSQVWWTGYDGQFAVIMDDFNGGWWCWDTLMQILDKYPLTVPVHGGLVPAKFERVVITTNTHPRDWYPKKTAHFGWDNNQNPLQRRIWHMELMGVPTQTEPEEEPPFPVDIPRFKNGLPVREINE